MLEMLGPPIGLFRVFARWPPLARGMHGWASYYFSRNLALNLRSRELVILRTTALCGADYEWGVHVAAYADRSGLTTAQLASLASGSGAEGCWTDLCDIAVLNAVDSLHAHNDLDDEVWKALVVAVGEAGALDLMLLAGWYHAISYTVRALRLAPEPGAPTLSDASHRSGRPLPNDRSASIEQM
jgi:alkylhydroperoxidase family enzyme